MRINDFEAIDIYKIFPDIDNDRYYNYRPRKKNKLVKGAKYALKGLSCDGFEMPERVYQVVAIVNDVNDVVLNSVVMRQLEGLADDVKYSLNKTECQNLHIKYEPGLQLFPIEMNWKQCTDKRDTGKTNFETNDMSTYPVSRIDGSIRYIILKINDFYIEDREVVNIKNDKRYPIEKFLSSIKISSKVYIKYGSNQLSKSNIFFMKTESIPFRILTEGYLDNVSSESLYIELMTKKPSKNVYTIDGISGINPAALTNKSINDIFDITIDEFILNKKKSNKDRNDLLYIPKDSFSSMYNVVSIKTYDDINSIHFKKRKGDVYMTKDTNKIYIVDNFNNIHTIYE